MTATSMMKGMAQQQRQQLCSVVLDMSSFHPKPLVVKKNHNNTEEQLLMDPSAPPLDCITVTTSSMSSSSHPDEEEDSSSCCSSVTADEDNNYCKQEEEQAAPAAPQQQQQQQQQQQHVRPIFMDYWRSQGYKQAPFYRSSVAASAALFLSPRFPTGAAAPENTVAEDQAIPAAASASGGRRSIFGAVSGQETLTIVTTTSTMMPRNRNNFGNNNSNNNYNNNHLHKEDPQVMLLLQLAAQHQPRPLARKTRSAPAMETRSVLKPSRYGKNATRASCSSSTNLARSVSFNDHVKVTLVPPRSVLMEQYAAQGWSEWFA